MNKTVSIFGLGYIGLPTAAMFANAGLNVIGIDINENIVTTINAGKIHIVEPGLEELVRKVINNGQLKLQPKLLQRMYSSLLFQHHSSKIQSR